MLDGSRCACVALVRHVPKCVDTDCLPVWVGSNLGRGIGVNYVSKWLFLWIVCPCGFEHLGATGGQIVELC